MRTSSRRNRSKLETDAWIKTPSDRLAVAEGCEYRPDKAEYVLEFIARFIRLTKGKWAGRPLDLPPWQEQWIRELYGWVRPDGTRRFRSAFLFVAKKNGKSTLLAALAAYHFLGEGEPRAEIYTAATTRKQASIIFGEAMSMVNASPHLASRVKCVPHLKTMVCPSTGSVFEALSGEADANDGPSASYVAFDELHRQRDDGLWNTLKYAGAGREQPLMVALTTAGDRADSLCRQEYDYAKKIESGVIPNVSHHVRIYEAQADCDILDRDAWAAANPSLGHILKVSDFADDARDAAVDPRKAPAFRRFRLNQWVGAGDRFLDWEAWRALGDPALALSAFSGDQGIVGLDLASVHDLTAAAFLFGQEDRWRLITKFWAPLEGVEERERRDRVPYRLWAEQGRLELTPGRVTDYGAIFRFVTAVVREIKLKVLLDPWNATQVGQALEREGLEVIEIGQRMANLNEPTKKLRRTVENSTLRHDDNPVMNWCVTNAVSITDTNENMKIDKKKSRGRIDGLAATINAFAGTLRLKAGPKPSVYQERDIFFL